MMEMDQSLRGLQAVVIGQGSIGRRHSRLLSEAGAHVTTVSAKAAKAFRSLADIPSLDHYQYAVIANQTARHAGALADLSSHGFVGRVLVEKPLFAFPPPGEFSAPFSKLRVGYNLRLHPAVKSLREALMHCRVIAVRMHAGQYLPDWRPEIDFRETSSASLEEGGGVLRDLSHEIDLLLYLFGPWSRLVAIRPRHAVLDIATDQAWGVIFELASGAVATLTLNYHDKPIERRYVVTADDRTIAADLIAGVVSNGDERQQFEVERDQSYRLLHTLMQDENEHVLCTLEEGLGVVETIAAIERSAACEEWVRNG